MQKRLGQPLKGFLFQQSTSGHIHFKPQLEGISLTLFTRQAVQPVGDVRRDPVGFAPAAARQTGNGRFGAKIRIRSKHFRGYFILFAKTILRSILKRNTLLNPHPKVYYVRPVFVSSLWSLRDEVGPKG
jgi:hypothetical protein